MWIITLTSNKTYGMVRGKMESTEDRRSYEERFQEILWREFWENR